MTARIITQATLAERLAARRLEEYARTHHVCADCGGITDGKASAERCIPAGQPVPTDGKPYHRARTTAQTARKVRNAGFIAAGLAAEEAKEIFG